MVLTLLWFLTVTNAVQFLDGMDGLAAGLGVIAGLFFSIAPLQTSQRYLFILAAPLVGACLGFLPYNFRPRRRPDLPRRLRGELHRLHARRLGRHGRMG